MLICRWFTIMDTEDRAWPCSGVVHSKWPIWCSRRWPINWLPDCEVAIESEKWQCSSIFLFISLFHFMEMSGPVFVCGGWKGGHFFVSDVFQLFCVAGWEEASVVWCVNICFLTKITIGKKTNPTEFANEHLTRVWKMFEKKFKSFGREKKMWEKGRAWYHCWPKREQFVDTG